MNVLRRYFFQIFFQMLLGYNTQKELPLSPAKFFNQRFLNYIHKFSADGDYVFFARSEVEQHHLSSLISIVIQRCRSGTTAVLMTINFKENMKKFILNSDASFFIKDIKIAY